MWAGKNVYEFVNPQAPVLHLQPISAALIHLGPSTVTRGDGGTLRLKKTTMRQLLAGAVLALCGSSCSGSGPGRCSGPTPLPENPTVARAGMRVSLDFEVPPEGDACLPSGMEASVLDPENATVDSAQTTLTGRRATVSFTPARGGTYHVVVRFNPNRGTAQADLVVAYDRSGEAGGVTLTGSVGNDIELSAGGVLRAGSSVYRVVNGQPVFVEQLNGTVMSAGEAIYTRTANDVFRHLLEELPDGGAQLVRRPSAAMTVSGSDDFYAQDDIAWLLTSFSPRRALATDAGWEVRDLASVSQAGWAYRVGDELIFRSPPADECVLDLDSDAGPRCTPVTTFFTDLGGDSKAFWLTSGSVLAMHATGNATFETNLGSATIAAASATSTVPLVDFGLFKVIAVPREGAMAFEYWGEIANATSTTVVTQTGTANAVRVRRR